jgi:hypothetical protein
MLFGAIATVMLVFVLGSGSCLLYWGWRCGSTPVVKGSRRNQI